MFWWGFIFRRKYLGINDKKRFYICRNLRVVVIAIFGCLMWPITYVVWRDSQIICSIFGHLQQMKFAQYHKNITIVPIVDYSYVKIFYKY